MKMRKPFDFLTKHYATHDCPGNRMEPEYKERYDEETGKKYLVKVGEINIYEKIQTYKDECDVHSILERMVNGDTSMLRTNAVYANISNMPKSYGEMFNRIKELQETFNNLPKSIREKFNNSLEEWASTSGTEEWFNKMGNNADKSENNTKNDSVPTTETEAK